MFISYKDALSACLGKCCVLFIALGQHPHNNSNPKTFLTKIPGMALINRFFFSIIVLCFLCILNPGAALSQDKIKAYVQANTVPIRNIAPDSVNYADLEAIGNAIGDAKIVFLGEQDHGDAPTFLAKTRLIKYLHEKKGFDVLAFESDFFGLTEGWNALPKNRQAMAPFIRKNIFPIWTWCNTCKELLFDYIPGSYETDRPLILTGFDDQLGLPYSAQNLVVKLDSVLQKRNIPLTKDSAYDTKILPLLKQVYLENALTMDSAIINKRGAYLREIQKQIIAATPSNDDYWIVIADNLVRENLQFGRSRENYWQRTNARDERMALNLKWLAEVKYPGKKIIAWAANAHVSKFNSHYPEEFLNPRKTMGGVFTADSVWATQTYILGFTSLTGTAGRIGTKKYDVPKPVSNSFERWINADYSYSFTDFKTYNSSNPSADENFFMSGSFKSPELHTYQKAQWNRIFDGVFFIRIMYACEVTKY